MSLLTIFKNTVLLLFFTPLFMAITCNEPIKAETAATTQVLIDTVAPPKKAPLVVGANNTASYLPMLKGKKVGVVANQTSVIFKSDGYTHLVDSLLALHIDIKKVFAPEHGFRGKADAGEHVNDDVDAKTGLPLLSLHGKNRKPKDEQLANIDVVVFDIQDVGVRFYTYIATLQLVMEACAKNGKQVIVLDRPNPNAHYVDGPTMETEHQNFLGMTNIPLVYGLTIGEYATMINEEGWLADGKKAALQVVNMLNYNRDGDYDLPVRPSPNLPNAQSINLYPSLGLFEGTNINAGRGTEFQFQRYGASFLDKTKYNFSYTPQPNFGSKTPKENGKLCYGKDLYEVPKMNEVSLQWLIDAYTNCTDKTKFFLTSGFTKHAGTKTLQKQIEAGKQEQEIKATWKADIDAFKVIRAKYLLY